jgi:hypothetical protein
MSEQQKQTAKAWAHALLAAVVMSVATAAAAWDGSNFKDLGRAIVVASILGAAAYLTRSPIPPKE